MRPVLKPFLPRGLYGRAALILIVPVVAIQIVVSVIFIQRHFEGVTRQMTQNVISQLRFLETAMEGAADAAQARQRAQQIAGPLGLLVDLPATWSAPDDRRHLFDLSGRAMIATLHANLPALQAVDLMTDDQVRLLFTSPLGPWSVSFDRRTVSASNPHQLLGWMILTSVLMTLIAYAFLRNQLRPIKRLAEAAEAFGKGRSVAYRPRGALEVRAAGAAFLDMRARIERQIEQRTLMLSGVSHDLRTPLTRMKLSLSMMPDDDPEVRAALRDVTDMERLVDEFLSFARGDAMEEPVAADPVALVTRSVENAQRAGHRVDLSARGAGQAMLRPDAVTRAVDNLIANAVRYGTRALVSIDVTERTVRICVEDDGPGIPPDRRDEAMRPFTRLDAARNPNRGGGVGLGLSIAADIARSHGGTLRLGESAAMGGLKAELVLAR